jgi:AraC-like DNA-binding protein
MASQIRTYADTLSVPPLQRVDYWNAYNRTALVGLRSSSLSHQGLMARQANHRVGEIGLADISGNDHFVERDALLVEQSPKNSVFVCQIQQGSGFFVQDGRHLLLTQGDLVIYDTRTPFLLGFLTEMHESLVDVPEAAFTRRTGIAADQLPIKITPDSQASRMSASLLGRTVSECMTQEHSGEQDHLAGVIYDTLSMLLRTQLDDQRTSATSELSKLLAKRYILQHLVNPELSPAEVAQAIRLSLRQLNRLFHQEGTSPARYIWEQRALRAFEDLHNPMKRVLTVGEIGFACGYSTQAHFSRAMKERFGMTPSEIRNQTEKD